MTILLDEKPLDANLAPNPTLADALNAIQAQLRKGQIIIKVELDGQSVEGPALSDSRETPLRGRNVAVSTADQKQLALAMLGKLAALIEWLAPQHAQVAALFEKGQTAPALEKLGGILSAWQQIQQAYSGLLTMTHLHLAELPVRELTADHLMNDFRKQLIELQTALQAQDYVLLADILQYEMDGVVANWTSILESTLARIAPEGV